MNFIFRAAEKQTKVLERYVEVSNAFARALAKNNGSSTLSGPQLKELGAAVEALRTAANDAGPDAQLLVGGAEGFLSRVKGGSVDVADALDKFAEIGRIFANGELAAQLEKKQ